MTAIENGNEPAVNLLLLGGTVITMDDARRVWDPGFVAIAEGRIVGVGPATSAPQASERAVDVSGRVVLPGLVNCHAHHGLTLLRGIFDEMDLRDWLQVGLWPGIRALTEERAYTAARVALAEMLLGGITTSTSSDWSYPHREAIAGVLRAIDESGMRGVVSRITHDSPIEEPMSQAIPPDLRERPEDVVAHVAELRSRFGSGRIRIGPEPLGVMRCTKEMVRTLNRFGREEGAPILMHIASSRGEVEGCRERYGMGCIEYLDSLEALHDGLLLAHCVWPSENEIRLIAQSGAGVSHNPSANLYYATGIAPLSELLDAGVKVGLGVDTAATNNSLNLWETMKVGMYLSKHRLESAEWGSAELALELSTLGGARALGLEDEVGSLEPGKKADVLVVRTDRPHLTPTTTIVSNLVYSPNPDAVDTVVVDGQLLVEDGMLKQWNLGDVLDEANRVALEMLEEAGLAGLVERRTSWSWNPGT